MKRVIVLALAATVFFTSCNNEEIGNSRDVNPERIFFDYKVNAEEDRDYVTVLLQYRFAGPEGTTLVLNSPSKVELDGVALQMDSSRMTGAYFEHHANVEDFTGKHVITFTDINEKVYTETFEFRPLTLEGEFPKEIERGDLELKLSGVRPLDVVRVVMTDTSFYSNGINRLDTVRDGILRFDKSDFARLVNGPVTIEIASETERPVRQATPEGGSFAMTYSLRRQFILR